MALFFFFKISVKLLANFETLPIFIQNLHALVKFPILYVANELCNMHKIIVMRFIRFLCIVMVNRQVCLDQDQRIWQALNQCLEIKTLLCFAIVGINNTREGEIHMCVLQHLLEFCSPNFCLFYGAGVRMQANCWDAFDITTTAAAATAAAVAASTSVAIFIVACFNCSALLEKVGKDIVEQTVTLDRMHRNRQVICPGQLELFSEYLGLMVHADPKR